MPRTEKQFQDIREEKKELIMQVALTLFAKQGYANSSIAQIAKEAKISKGLIYNYFESKDALIKEILMGGFDQLMVFFERNKDGVFGNAEFEYFVNETFALMKKNEDFWRIYLSLAFQPNIIKLIEKELMETLMPILSILDNYYAERKHPSPQVMTRLFLAVLDGVGLHYLSDPDNFPLDEVVKMVLKMFKE